MTSWTWDDARVCSFDFETSGTKPEYALQPWRADAQDFWATSLAWVWPESGQLRQAGGLAPIIPKIFEFVDWAVPGDRTVCGWNLLFDLSVLLAYGVPLERLQKLRWLDGMLLWRHLEIEPEYDESAPRKSYSLKAFVAEHMPEHAGYEAEIDFHDTSPEARARLHEYNVKDVAFTLKACKRLWRALEPAQQQAALIEAECLPMVAAANLRGLLIDTPAANDLRLKLEAQAAVLLAKLAPDGVSEEVVRSPKKLGVLLFDQWGLPCEKKTATGARATSKDVLHELAFIDPRVKELRDYREVLNQATKFAAGLIEAATYCEDGGYAHPLAHVFGTYSGRFTYSSKQSAVVERVRTFKRKPPRVDKVQIDLPIGFALHQMKRGADFRGLVVALPGYTIVEFDASGQEFRWMAVASGDETMLQLCAEGEDPHSFMGDRIEPGTGYRELIKLVAEENKAAKNVRQGGKVANLSLQYRTSAKKLMQVARVDYGMDMTLTRAEYIHTVYQRTYRQVPKYWQRQITLTKERGYVETFAGRRVQVKGDWQRFGWSMGSTAINYRIQGTGGDQKYLALSLLKDYCTDMGARFLIDLHDGLYFLVPDAKVSAFAEGAKRLLDDLPYQAAWGFTPPIPMPWDCKAGKSWGSLKGIRL